jgi:hypothetical protein
MVVNMATNKEEMQIRIVEHIGTILFYFLASDDLSEDEDMEMDDNTLDMAAIIAATINLEVQSVDENDNAIVSMRLEDPILFIKNLTDKQ